MKRRMHFDIKVGEVLKLGDVEVRLEKKSGRAARLEVRVPEDARVTKADRATVSGKSTRMSASAHQSDGVDTHGKYPV